MNGLFKKVLKGQYPPIPSHYSMDMRQLIKTLLQVDPKSRPDCQMILQQNIVQKRIKKYFNDKDKNWADMADMIYDDELLRTIKLNKNLFKMKLPKQNYDSNFKTIPGVAAIKNSLADKGRLTVDSTETVEKKTSLPRIAKAKPDYEEKASKQSAVK